MCLRRRDSGRKGLSLNGLCLLFEENYRDFDFCYRLSNLRKSFQYGFDAKNFVDILRIGRRSLDGKLKELVRAED